MSIFPARVIAGVIVPDLDDADDAELDLEEGEELTVHRSDAADEWSADDLDDEERASILRGLEQSERGEGIPHEKALSQLRRRRANPQR